MAEVDWRRCKTPGTMLDFLRGRVSDRKIRLFACACCRKVWHTIADDRARRAVEVTEQFADGTATQQDLAATLYEPAVAYWERPFPEQDAGTLVAIHLATFAGRCEGCLRWAAVNGDRDRPLPISSRTAARMSDLYAYAMAIASEAARAGSSPNPYRPPRNVGQKKQAALLRDIVGNPFRAVAIDPASLAWHGGAVKRLAEAVCEERSLPSGHPDAARLAVLADMPEEAGCTDASLLTHLRPAGPHVRGCVAVDAILGRT